MSPGRRNSGRGSGKISRRTALALIAGGGFASLGASGAFSSVEGGRRVDLDTKNDDTALLELVSTAEGSPSNTPLNLGPISYTVTDGETIALIDLTNTVGESIDFTTLAIDDSANSNLSVTLQSAPSSLNDGETATLEAKITCPSAGACGDSIDSVSVDLNVVAEGETTTVDLTRTLEVSCSGTCVSCTSGDTKLVKYEWKACSEEDDDDSDSDDDPDSDSDDDEDCDDDDDDDDSGGSGKFDIEDDDDDDEEDDDDENITHVSTTLDSEGEPKEATFSTDYCSVDAVVKAGPNEETYENVSCEFTVSQIDGKAISHVRFYCDAPDGGGSPGNSGGSPGNSGGSGDDDDDDDD